MADDKPRFVIAGTGSGVGKTTITMGLMAALSARGLAVQGFKVGPDFIDPTYHTAVTGRPSRNLDTWMMHRNIVREIFHRGSDGADISVIEGVMGMYDGKDPLSDVGSTAEVSKLLQAPVILVVNAANMARSAAAVVLGFQRIDPTVPIAGVIVNQVGSARHYELVKAAIDQVCDLPVIGYLARQPNVDMPERHLGLIPALERGDMKGLFEALRLAVEETIDVDALIYLAQRTAPWREPISTLFSGRQRKQTVTIAVARDRAFNFYYPENIELLEWYGASIRYFRPVDGEVVPKNVDGVYIGGGFPEEFAATLAQQVHVKASFQHIVNKGVPLFAECGGFMYLTDTLTDALGTSHVMAGVIPAAVAMQKRLVALGYREVTALTDTLLLQKGECARGHEFHYSNAAHDVDSWPYAYESDGMRGNKQEGYTKGNLLAGYTHLHFASNPKMALRFVEACERFQQHHRPLHI